MLSQICNDYGGFFFQNIIDRTGFVWKWVLHDYLFNGSVSVMSHMYVKWMWSVSNMTYFVMKRIHLQLKVVKYYFFKWQIYSLFTSQESPQIVASKTLPAKTDTLQYPMPIWMWTKISIFQCSSPNLLKTKFISCNNCILWTLFLDIKQKGKCIFILFCENASKEYFPAE